MGVPDEHDLGQDHELGNRQACQLSACILAEVSIRTHRQSIHDTLGRDRRGHSPSQGRGTGSRQAASYGSLVWEEI